ncbi:MAG: effector-associated domain EAD1-containing protein [Chloroflexota bacterium]
MSLSGFQIREICDALESGYTESDLKMMVRTKLSEKFDHIAGGSNLKEKIFNLVEWAENTGRVEELIQVAHQYRPYNPKLQLLVDKVHDFVNEALKYTKDQRPRSYVPNRSSIPLIGREQLLQKILKTFVDETSDSLQFMTLHGQPGVGKTRLAIEVAQHFFNELDDKETFHAVIFHHVDRLADFDEPNEALSLLIYQLAECLRINVVTRSSSELKSDILRIVNEQAFKLLIVLDGLRDEVQEKIIDFTEYLPTSVKILITRNKELNHSEKSDLRNENIEVEGIPEESIIEFLVSYFEDEHLHDSTFSLPPEDIADIHNRTLGNAVALEAIARAGKDKIRQNLNKILDRTIEEETIAGQWIGREFDELMPEQQILLKAQVLFKGAANAHILIEIASKEPNVSLTSDEGFTSLNMLAKSRILINDQRDNYFRMADPYWNYIRRRMINESELDRWRGYWVDYYCDLRKRARNFHDEAGWTIFSDYRPDLNEQIDYNEEVETIIDVIRYCLSDKRVCTRWRNAAELLDDFRATLFSAGKWGDRVKFCEKILENAELEHDYHTVGQVERLRAWMYCFQDDYVKSREFAAKALDTASEGIQNKNSTSETRIIHRQTYYKALNTLGQIALREGQETAIKGQIARRDKRQEEAHGNRAWLKRHFDKEQQENFDVARDKFRLARYYFVQAYGFVGAEFAWEQTIIDFHMAEVDYYDRHPSIMEDEETRKNDGLTKSHNAFSKLLTQAENRLQPNGELQSHERLIAHVQYYLGKIHRRLVESSHFDTPSEEPSAMRLENFEKASEHLWAARMKAEQFGDRVLRARIDFAIGQWYEHKAQYALSNAEREKHIENSRKHVQQSVQELKEWGMELESWDVAAFWNQRLEIQ